MPENSYIRVAAAVPKVSLADPAQNVETIIQILEEIKKDQPDMVVFPELSLTGYSCGELFQQETLYQASLKALETLRDYSAGYPALLVVGNILKHRDVLYNCALVLLSGQILGVVPKEYLPNKQEFYDKRWFASGRDFPDTHTTLLGQEVPTGSLIFSDPIHKLSLGIEICEDLWAPVPPSTFLYLKGANVVANLSASNALVGKIEYRRTLVSQQSARFNGAYVYASAGVDESTTDYLMDGHTMIGENGVLLKEGERFSRDGHYILADLDPELLSAQRLRNSSFQDSAGQFSLDYIRIVNLELPEKKKTNFHRTIDSLPFVPANPATMAERCREIFQIQTLALAKRMEHSQARTAVLGISGGLDSTLAFLVVRNTFRLLGRNPEDILAVTMPGFGTTDHTYQNARKLIHLYGARFMEINIEDACRLHFQMIGHDPKILDVTYENVQARERTALLMNLANKHGGLVIGTGDLSELALGWCTYNGDHMSMYAVNNSVPKTLVKHLVQWVATEESPEKQEILKAIIDTPISPELLPKSSSGEILQKTEEILGPYQVHDFFLFHFVKNGFAPDKLLFLAEQAFAGTYTKKQLQPWLQLFLKRFFTQQFKRSCLPDGPKVGSVSLSPRADWKMPSDASVAAWLSPTLPRP